MTTSSRSLPMYLIIDREKSTQLVLSTLDLDFGSIGRYNLSPTLTFYKAVT